MALPGAGIPASGSSTASWKRGGSWAPEGGPQGPGEVDVGSSNSSTSHKSLGTESRASGATVTTNLPERTSVAASLWNVGSPSFRLSPEALDFLSAPPAPSWSVSGVLSHFLSFADFLRRPQLGTLVKGPLGAPATSSSRQPLFASLRQWLDFNAAVSNAGSNSSGNSLSSSSSSSSKLRLRAQGPPALKQTEAVALWGIAAALAFIQRQKHIRRGRRLKQQQQQQKQRLQKQQQQGEVESESVFPSVYYPSAAAAAAAAAEAAARAASGVISVAPQPSTAATAATAAAAVPLLDSQTEVLEVRALALLLLLLTARRQQQQILPSPEDRWFSLGATSPSRSGRGPPPGAPYEPSLLSLPSRRTNNSSSKGSPSEATKLRVYLLQHLPQLLQLLQLVSSDARSPNPQQQQQQQQQHQQQETITAWELGVLEVFLESDSPAGFAASLSGDPLVLLHPHTPVPTAALANLLGSSGRRISRNLLTDEISATSRATREPQQDTCVIKNLKGSLRTVTSASLGKATILRLSSSSKSDIYITRPVEALFIEGLSESSVVAPAVLGPIFLKDCCRLQLHARAKSLFVDNTLGAELFVASCFPPVLLGDSRDLSLGPYNILTRPLQQPEQQQQQLRQEQGLDLFQPPKKAETPMRLPWTPPPLSLIVSSFAFPVCLCPTVGEAEAAEEPLSIQPFKLIHPNHLHMVPGFFEPERCEGLGFFSSSSLPLPQQYLEAVQSKTTKAVFARQVLQQRGFSEDQSRQASHVLSLMLLEFCRKQSAKTRRFLQHLSKRTEEQPH